MLRIGAIASCFALPFAIVAGACVSNASEVDTASGGENEFNKKEAGADADAAKVEAGGPPLHKKTWDDVEGLSDGDLVNALNAAVSNHTDLTYAGARAYLFGVGGEIDFINGSFECIYTGKRGKPDGTTSPGEFNTEHSWPKSQGAEVEPAKSDLHHLFPATEVSNSARSSYPFGVTDCDSAGCLYSESGSKLGVRKGGTETVFDVRPERRGDIARAHFYFSVRYLKPISSVEEPTLREWNKSDPPDERERARNDAIEALQRNRNPFIDRPDLVDQIDDF